MIKETNQYHASKLRPLIQIVGRIVSENPGIMDNMDYFISKVGANIPGFHNKEKCLNCGASMQEYLDILDINDALLLFSMAKIVRTEQLRGVPFTEANKIRVSSADIHHTQKCRTTKCSKLGLIAKAENACWSITTRGWAALRGEEVPKTRVTFRGRILERPEETTTLSRVFAEHSEKMKDREGRRKSLQNDKRHNFFDYDPSDWVTVAGLHQGELI